MVFLLITLLLYSYLSAQSPCANLQPGTVWNDNKAVHINAHGGGIFFHKGIYPTTICPAQGSGFAFSRTALGIFNLLNNSLSYNDISLSQMGLKGGMIRDLWRQQDLGVFDDILKVKIPARGVLLYKISKVENKK